jgi:CRP-like cAMP-binding protein
MYFQQSDLLRGMSKDFVREFMDVTVKESYRKGYFIFREGKQATHFYILLKGKVSLSIGETGHSIYAVDHAGEVFGWSSLVGRDVYSASAECKAPTILIKVDTEKVQELLEKNPADGLIFFKRLALTIGNRLLQTYKLISSASQPEISTSFGSGQVIESETTVG